MFLKHAAEVLCSGGIIAYPTEGVYGLGCLPDEDAAVERVLRLKQRAAGKGLILIAAQAEQLDGWIDLPAGRSLPKPDLLHPLTWIVPPGPFVHSLLSGDNVGIAVRLTTNHRRPRALQRSGLTPRFNQRKPDRQTDGPQPLRASPSIYAACRLCCSRGLRASRRSV